MGCIVPLVARAAPFGARQQDLFFCYWLTGLACDGRTEGCRRGPRAALLSAVQGR